MNYAMVVLETRVEQVGWEVIFNGGLVQRNFTQAARTDAHKLNPWLVEGTNQLEVAVVPLPGRLDFDETARLELAVFQGAHGRHPGEAGKLFDFQWRYRDQPVTAGQVVCEQTLSIDQSHGRWVWQDSQPFTSSDRPAIAALLSKYRQTLVNRDFAALSALTQQRDQELATAYDVSLAEVVETEKVAVQGVFGADDWRVEPLEPDQLQFWPRAGDRLVEVTHGARQPAIRAFAGGDEIEFHVTVANLNGGWTIIR